MTKVNHRRKNRKPVALRHTDYRNGYSIPASHIGGEAVPTKHQIESTDPTESYQRVGRTRFLDKSLHGWGRKSELSDRTVSAHIGNDFSNGHRGMAKSVRGAKKFVRSRFRFHENNETKRLANNLEETEY